MFRRLNFTVLVDYQRKLAIKWLSVKPASFGTISTAWTFQVKCLIAQMFPGGVNSVMSDALRHPKMLIFLNSLSHNHWKGV